MIFLLGYHLASAVSGRLLKFFVILLTATLIAGIILLAALGLCKKKLRWYGKLPCVCLILLLAPQLFCTFTFFELSPKAERLAPIAAIPAEDFSFDRFYLPECRAFLVSAEPTHSHSGKGALSFVELNKLAEEKQLPSLGDGTVYLFVKDCDSVTVTSSVWGDGNQWKFGFGGYHRSLALDLVRNTETADDTVYVFQVDRSHCHLAEDSEFFFNYFNIWSIACN